jgi:hypothetical protein
LRLNHINICASDVPGVAYLLIKHFEYNVLQAGNIPGASDGPKFSVLEGRDGSSLVITEITKAADPAYPEGFHFGIMMGSFEEVQAKHQELVDAGLQPEKINDFEALGSTWKSFMCPIGDGMKIEVNHRRD